MQVGNVYVDIKIVGSNKNNILNQDNMRVLQITETAGASLPYAWIRFFTFESNLADFFQENNTIEITMGTSPQDCDTFQMFMLDGTKDQDPSGSGWIIDIAGFLYSNAYMVGKFSEAYAGNSLIAIRRALQKYLGKDIVTDIKTVKENQVNWMQTQETLCSFVNKTLLHMDIRPSFPLYAFDKFGNFRIRDYQEVLKEPPKFTFSPAPSEKGEIQYVNNFNVDSYKASYNLYSGYNKVTEICDATKGTPKYVVDQNVPILASSTQSEQLKSGNRITLNRVNSPNVHKTYNEAFAHNANKLLSLSSMEGCLQLVGSYHKEIAPIDLVQVITEHTTGSEGTLGGLYLVDTIVTHVSFVPANISTYVYVTRDNKNNVENYITLEPKKIVIRHNFLEELNNAVADLRTAAAVCSSIMDGSYLNRLRDYATSSKNSLMRIFSIAGVTIDLKAQKDLLKNFLLVGNSLMNTLLSMILPSELFNIFKDYLVMKPTLKESLSKAVTEVVPPALQDIVQRLIDSIGRTHNTLNSIAEDNGVTVKGESKVPSVPVEENINDEGDRVTPILDDFENNTSGLDIPFPLIELTDEQNLMPENELRDYIADQTIENLTELGYMDGIDPNDLKNVLLGEEANFALINQLNKNAGNISNYRFWGTFGPSNEALYAWVSGENVVYTKTPQIGEYTRFYNDNYSPYAGTDFRVKQNLNQSYSVYYGDEEAQRDEKLDVNSNALVQLTSFYINDSFKDRYKTIPCTKLISALKNARIFFACPKKEDDIKFYINSKRVILDSFPIDLGYKDIYGNTIPYLVYYTSTGYNSNSVLFEVRQGV